MAAVLFHLWPEARPELIWATLFHDVSERVTGDIPANVKRASPEVASAVHLVSSAEEKRLGIRFDLHPEEAKLLAWIDRYEGALHCLDELEMGNRKVVTTMLRYMHYAGMSEYVLICPERERARQVMLAQLHVRAGNFITNQENE